MTSTYHHYMKYVSNPYECTVCIECTECKIFSVNYLVSKPKRIANDLLKMNCNM